MKKLISIILTLAMVATMFVAAVPASAAELGVDTQAAAKAATVPDGQEPADFDGDGVTDEGASPIKSVSDFRNIVNGKKYYLDADIVIKTGEDGVAAGVPVKGWTGSGIYLDGCGHTIEFDKNAGDKLTATSLFDGSAATMYIKNLNITGVINASPATGDDHVSALSRAGGGAVLENVVSDVDITINSIGGNSAVGGVWSKTEQAMPVTAKNVHFTGSITMKCAVPTGGYGGVGGIVGFAQCDITMEDCSNSGNITVGVAGMTLPTGTENYGVGGLIGKVSGNKARTATIKRSANSGNIEIVALNNAYVGGIVGYSLQSNLVIDSCTNSGTIKAGNSVSEHAGFGGILGCADNNTSTCKIEIIGCSNTAAGKITTRNETVKNVYAGGIVGRLLSVADVSIISCSNAADIDISKGDAWSSAGGIVGTVMTIGSYSWANVTSSNVLISKCQNSGKISSGIWAAGIIASGIQLHSDSILIRIEYCINTASAEIKAGLDSTLNDESRAVAGGIAGMMGEGNSTSLAANANADYGPQPQFGNLEFAYCTNQAPVTAGASARAAGGILGRTDGDSLNGITAGGTDSKKAAQETFYGVTCDSYTQRTWFEYCGNSGNVTCQNASGKVASIAGSVANKYYLWYTQALGTRTLGTAQPGTNTWVVDYWVAQDGNDINSDKMATLVSDVNAPVAKSFELTALIVEVERAGISDLQTKIDAARTARKSNAIATMNTAYSELYNAFVIATLDKTKLDAVIKEAEALARPNYTDESWRPFTQALADAKTALNSTSQAIIDAAEESLRDAMATLVLKENEPEIDYSALRQSIATAQALDSTNYTETSWAAVTSALAAANEALNSNSQTDVDNATSALNAAIEALESVNGSGSVIPTPPAGDDNPGGGNEGDNGGNEGDNDNNGGNENEDDELDFDALTTAIELAEGLTEADYTAESWAAVGMALVNAKKALTATTQDAIDAATAAIDMAIAALVEAGDASDGNTETKDDADVTEPDSDAEDSDEDTEEDKKEKKGCGSVIAASSVVLATVLALGLGFKKKED